MAGIHFYHLIEWEKEEGEDQSTVSIVPDKWLVLGTNSCKWPRNASTNLIRRNSSPQRSWGTYPYTRIVKSSANWEKMKKWETEFMEQTDLDTTDTSDQERSPKRGRCRPKNGYRDFVRVDLFGNLSPERPPAASSPQPSPKRPRIFMSPIPPSRSTITEEGQSPNISQRSARQESDTSSASDIIGALKPYFGAILKSIEELRAAHQSSVAQIQAEIRTIKQTLKQGQGATAEERRNMPSRPELPQSYSFPLKTADELEKLNTTLMDDSIRQRLEHYLYNLGGVTFRVSVRMAASVLMAPELQGQYNITGSNKSGLNKSALNKMTYICCTLFNAVHRRHQTDKQLFFAYLGDWLSTYRDRLVGGKKNRPGEQRKNMESLGVNGDNAGEAVNLDDLDDDNVSDF